MVTHRVWRRWRNASSSASNSHASANHRRNACGHLYDDGDGDRPNDQWAGYTPSTAYAGGAVRILPLIALINADWTSAAFGYLAFG